MIPHSFEHLTERFKDFLPIFWFHCTFRRLVHGCWVSANWNLCERDDLLGPQLHPINHVRTNSNICVRGACKCVSPAALASVISKIASRLLEYRRVSPRIFSYQPTILLMHGSRFTFTCDNPAPRTALRLFPVTVASSILTSRLR